MELLQLQYFECIAKNESVTKAAEELRISQPSLSGSLLRLEKELGAPLFERKNRKMILTSYGEYFLSTTRKVLELINSSKLSFSADMPARFAVGFQNYNERFFSLMEEFQRRYPTTEFNVYGSTLNAPFATGSFSFIVGPSNLQLPFSTNKVLLEPRHYYVAVPQENPLSQREFLSIEELRDEPFCFIRDEHGKFEYAYQFCIEGGFIPKCVFSTNNAFYKYRYVANGSSFAFFPSGWYPVFKNVSKAVLVPLKGFKKHSDTLLYWPQNVQLSPAEQAFLAFILNRIEAAPLNSLGQVGDP